MPWYADEIEAENDGLIHYWDFNEVSTTLTDRIRGWEGVVQVSDEPDRPASSVTAGDVVVPSMLGNAIDLAANIPGNPDGPDTNYVTPVALPAYFAEPSPPAWSFRLRFYWRGRLPSQEGQSSVYPALLWFDAGFWVDIAPGGWLSAYTSGAGYLATITLLEENAWHEILVTYTSAGQLSLYLNGTQEDSRPGLFVALTDSPLTIGATPGAVHQPDCIIDEFAIWDRALSAQVAVDLWNSGSAVALLPASTPNPPAEVSIDATLPITVSAAAFQDWVSKIPPVQLQEVYQLVITGASDGLDDLHIVGISSWQATNQAAGRSSYLQAVIPAADAILPEIESRQNGDLVIRKGYRFADGSVRYEEIMRSRFDILRPDRGQRALTVTVSGYLSGKSSASGTRTLAGIRSISSQNGKLRVRCDIDLFLQPGMTVTALGESFRADYINYYVTEADKFCEVAER